MQTNPIECNQVTTQEQAKETLQTRKVTFQDSYEELIPSTSNTQPAQNEPSRLVGFQNDPKLHERQKEEQREERKTNNAPVDLRDKLNATKRAREQDGQTSSRSNRGTPAPSPSQPEARRQKVARELLTAAEMKQLDITARDALRLQREIPNMPDEENPPRQKFASANSRGDQTTQRTIEKANIGVVYNRPVKPPIFANDGGLPPWFERLRRELQNSNSSYLQPLQATNERLARQRPGRFGENHLQSKNYARNPITLLPMGKDLLQKIRIALFVDSTIKSSYNANNTLMDVRLMNMPCTTLNEMAEVTDKMFTPAAAETIPLPPILIYSNVIDHLALRGSLRHFDALSTRFTEGFVTDEVTAYIETMSRIATMMRNKKPNTGTVFVSPPGYIYLPRALQQFLYLVMEASYARDLHFYIVAPNLRINVTTWRPCEASYPAFLADISKAVQGYTGYEGNSQLLVDEATAYDYGMQMSIRSLDENGVRKVFDPNESERKHLIDNLWFERRDESTLNEKTHDPKFHKELLALFKETETIKAERTNTTVFPIAAIATDAKLDMASLTLTLLMVMARGLAKPNEIEPSHTYQTWHKTLRETLNQVALRLEIPFPVLLYNISPFWLPSFVQAEFNLDDQQVRLYTEAMQQATMSEILAYLMAVGMHVVYRGPSGILQKLIFDKGNLPLFSYLVYAQNQKNWLQAILGALDPYPRLG